VPTGKKIHVKDCAAAPAECPQGTQDDGKWVMPVGTVMVKSFGFDGKLIETRLLVHPDATTWNGYAYKWNEAQTEATVVPRDEDLNNVRANVDFNTGAQKVHWTFPYRYECPICHTPQAGGTLGMETRQMNRTVALMNQIDAWKTKGLFEATGPKTPYAAAYVLPYDGQLGKASGTLEERARSYLHANCGYCHRPDGDFMELDFRYATTLKNTGACGVVATRGNTGGPTLQILKPGLPMESAMWQRMNAPFNDDKWRMPQLATYVVDTAGLKLVGDWIAATTTCPP